MIALFEQAIRLGPRDPLIGVSYFHIGALRLLQSCTDEAMLWLEKARSAMPEHVLQHAYLASVCGLIGDTERAAAELTEVHRLRVDDPLLEPRPIGAVLRWGVIVSQPERRRMI